MLDPTSTSAGRATKIPLLQRPIVAAILSTLSGATLVSAGLTATATWARVFWFLASVVPALLALVKRWSTRLPVRGRSRPWAAAIHIELAARGPLPHLDETPQRFRARLARRGDGDRPRDRDLAESVQDVTL